MRSIASYWLAVTVLVAGCAEATRSGGGDLSMGVEDGGLEDAGEDLAVELPDLTIVCDAGAGLRVCGGKCITDTQCCGDSECPTPAHGAPLCNNLNRCDVACDTNYKPCNGACIAATNCCSDADCNTAPDVCKLVQGATCGSGVCTYPAVQCPYAGQFCDISKGGCVCPANQHPCVTVSGSGPMGQCIPDNTCCTNADCGAITGEVCTGVGMTCACTAGLKPCTASHSCIPQSSCCDNSDCGGGTSCSGPGGSCNCPAMQKYCMLTATCIPITACCQDSDCSAVSGRICQTGVCQCPSGKRECDPVVGSPTCITNSPSVCCIDSDCSMSNAKCSGIGGSCGCPSGTYSCSGNNACIANNLCCANGDCVRIRNINGESCSGPGGTCSCPANTKECPSGGAGPGSCVSTASGSCCPSTVNSDCAANHVCAPSCSGNSCGIPSNGCCSGFVDVDGSWSNGCECQDDGFGKGCGSATAIGPVNQNSGTWVSVGGVLPVANEENWFKITFNGTTNNSYHPHVTISSVDDIRFDVFSGANCSSPTLSCPDRSNAPATNMTNWELVASAGGDQSGIGCGSGCGVDQCICNNCSCTGAYNGMPAAGTIYVKVHRATGNPTCHGYTLSVTE